MDHHTPPPESDEQTAHLESRINTAVMDRVTFLFTGQEPPSAPVPNSSMHSGSVNSEVSVFNRLAPANAPPRRMLTNRMTQISNCTGDRPHVALTQISNCTGDRPHVALTHGYDGDACATSRGTPDVTPSLLVDPRLSFPPPVDRSHDDIFLRKKTRSCVFEDNTKDSSTRLPVEKSKMKNLVRQIMHGDEIMEEIDAYSDLGDAGGGSTWSANGWNRASVVDRLLDAGKRYLENAEEKRKQKTAAESSHVKQTFQSAKSVAINRKNKRDFYERRLLYIEKKSDDREQQAQEKQMKELALVTGRPKINPKSRKLAAKQEINQMDVSVKKWVMQRRLCRKEEAVKEEREAEEAKQFSFKPTVLEQGTDERFFQLKPFHLRLIGYTEKWLNREKQRKFYIARNMIEETFQPEVGHRTRTMSPRGSAVFDALHKNARRPPSLTRTDTEQTVRVPNTTFDTLADIVSDFGRT